jgi:putative transposase
LPTDRLVHHSDRGIQYASRNYTGLLKERRIVISMGRKGNPYGNAACEPFLKTLECEKAYRQEYRDLGEVLDSIGGLYRACLQPKATALSVGLSLAIGV